MRPSQMQLDHYYFDELSFSLGDDYTFEPGVEEPKILAEDLDVVVQQAQHPDDPLQWMFKLSIHLDNKDKKFPYTFSIRVTGFFDISKDCPRELMDRLALVNGPSILYAAARELLAVVTGRSRLLTIFLPTVSFFEPPKEAKVDALASAGPPKELSKQSGSRKPSGRKKVSKKR